MAMGMSDADRQGVFSEWAKGLRELARRPNVMAKIGGFGLPFWGFGFDQAEVKPDSDTLARTWRPCVETGIEAFGTGRCMMESNFPVDAMSCDYVTLWNALKKIAARYSADERAAMFAGTARRVYNL